MYRSVSLPLLQKYREISCCEVQNFTLSPELCWAQYAKHRPTAEELLSLISRLAQSGGKAPPELKKRVATVKAEQEAMIEEEKRLQSAGSTFPFQTLEVSIYG